MSLVDKKTGEILVSPFSKFKHESVGRDCGSMIIQNYEFSWDNDIRDFIVVEGEKEDRQAYIDSFADDTGVYNVLKKYAKTGDLSVLNRSEGFYADISDLPVDQLNPAKLEESAQTAVSKLSKVLGEEITGEQLSKMSAEEIQSLIDRAVAARSPKTEEVKDGEK